MNIEKFDSLFGVMFLCFVMLFFKNEFENF